MPELNLNKMKEILKSKNMKYDELAELTGISKSTISKLFGGFSKNPTLANLKSIATALDCAIDDFFEWEQEPTSPYYLDRKTAELAQQLYENQELKILFDVSKDLPPEVLKKFTEMIECIKRTNLNA